MSEIQKITQIEDHPLAPRNDKQLSIRRSIEDMEFRLKAAVADGEADETVAAAGTEEGEEQTKHYYGDGVYARSLLIPAGTAVVGRVHQQARICMIMQGRCTFTDEYHRKTVEAPWIGEFKAGTKTAVFAHTDTLWVATLGTELDDSFDIIDTLTCENHEQYHAMLEAASSTKLEKLS